MIKIISYNRKAQYNYIYNSSFEAGIVLKGTEVKSLRVNGANIADSYAIADKGELWICNMHIKQYLQGNLFNHQEKRLRKLLLHNKEINKIIGAIKQKQKTIIPIKIYFNQKNLVKLAISIAVGKNKFDKRESIKRKTWNREKLRLLKYK